MDMFPPSFKSFKLKRGPQIITAKDAGMIIAFTGVGQGWKVVDVGAGSGFLAIFLGNVVGKEGKITSYERRAEFADLAEKNVEKAGLKGIVEIKRKDAFEGIEEKNVDLITLDLAESDKLLESAKSAVRKEGIIVGYLPNIEQAKKFVLEAERIGLKHETTMEFIGRDWLIREQGCRPATMGLMHTSFLSFLKKEKE